MTTEISPHFRDDDRRALEAIDRKRDDLQRAKRLSPSLVPVLESEIEACVQALEKAREAGRQYEIERAEAERATVLLRAATSQLNTSHAVEPEAVDAMIRDVERAKYLDGARTRRRDAARTAAESGYARATKDIAERNAAVQYAERLAGAVVDREQDRVQDETRPNVIAWLRLTLPDEGRAAYERSYAYRVHHPSYPVPPSIEEYDAACKAFFGRVELRREQAAQQAAALAGV